MRQCVIVHCFPFSDYQSMTWLWQSQEHAGSTVDRVQTVRYTYNGNEKMRF